MTKEEFRQHLTQYDDECKVMSFVVYDHPCAVALHEAGEDILPLLVEELRWARWELAAGNESLDDCPIWLVIALAGDAMKADACPTQEKVSECMVGMKLDDEIDWLIKWYNDHLKKIED